MDRRGPYCFAIVRLGEGWPMTNLHQDGCKHDVTVTDAELVRAGMPRPCAKCGCLLIPWPVIRDAVRDFEKCWRGTEVLTQELPREEELAKRADFAQRAEVLWALADQLDPAGVNQELRNKVRKLIVDRGAQGAEGG